MLNNGFKNLLRFFSKSSTHVCDEFRIPYALNCFDGIK